MAEWSIRTPIKNVSNLQFGISCDTESPNPSEVEQKDGKASILTDSMNSCNWIDEGLDNNYLVHLIRDVTENNRYTELTIQWIYRAMVGIQGNDLANDYESRRCQLVEISQMKTTFVASARHGIKQIIVKEWQSHFHDKSMVWSLGKCSFSKNRSYVNNATR